MSNHRRQQTPHNPAPDFVQGVQKHIHVSLMMIVVQSWTHISHNSWNEWITFPLKYRDLPLNAQITFTVWDIEGPRTAAPVGGTTFRMFGKKRSVLLVTSRV